MVARVDLRGLSQDGVVEFASSPDVPTIDVARAVGAVDLHPGLADVQAIQPREGGEGSSYSGNFGTAAFPLHTDMAHWHVPPRFILLRCVTPSPSVSTLVVPSRHVTADMPKNLLRSAFFRARRPLDGRVGILRLWTEASFRWDQTFIEPLNGAGRVLRAAVMERIHSIAPRELTMDEPGKCILIDNWQSIHGRSAVPPSAMARVVERVYLSKVGG